jgi:hypothetical protein
MAEDLVPINFSAEMGDTINQWLDSGRPGVGVCLLCGGTIHSPVSFIPGSHTHDCAEGIWFEAEHVLQDADPIVKRYAELFDVASAPWNSSMHFGIQVEQPAWRMIVERLCARLRPLAAAARDQGIEFAIVEVKGKFGSLRINYRGGTDEIEAEVDKAKLEALSSLTVSSLGSFGHG